MKLLTLTLNNFRQFYGRQQIKFSTDNHKNITLIHAENGVGKTALLNAIKWCLFEETTDNFRDKKNLLNHEAKESNEYFYSVDIDFEEDGEFYSCTRGIDARNQPYFKILKENQGTFQPIADTSLFINSIIPKNMASYFFFQGEGVSSFARTTSGPNQTVKNAIHDVLGFKIAKQTLDDLAEIKNEYLREMKNRDKTGELGALADELLKIETNITQLIKELEECKNAITFYEKRINELDEMLINSNAEVVKQNHGRRDKLEKQGKSIETNIKSLEKRRRELLGEYLSPIFASKLASQALDFINEEEFKGTIPAPYNENLVRDILEQATCICGAPIHEGSPAFANVEKLLAKAANPLQGDRVIRARETLKAIRVKNEMAIKLINENIGTLSEKKNEMDKNKAELAEISLRLTNSNIEEIRSLENERNDAKAKLKVESTRSGMLQEKLGNNKNFKQSSENKIKQMQSISTGLEIYQKSKSILEKVEKLISDTLEKAEATALTRLPNMINEILAKYVRQDYRAKLSKTTFNLQLIDRADRPVAESDGQQLLLSLTFISSLIKMAAERKNASGEILMPGAIAPFVIDAPFGVLDNAYKGNMAKYIPESVEQVVFLLSSSHWEGAVEENIRHRVGAEYNLVAEVSSPQGDKDLNPITVCGKVLDTARYECPIDRTVIEEINL